MICHYFESAAVLFVDVVNAFNSVVRALAFVPEFDIETTAQVFRSFSLPPEALHEFLSLLNTSAFDLCGVDPHLSELIAEAHNGTWFTTKGRVEVMATESGTKPGDPLGDVIFNYIMWRVLGALEARLQELDIIQDVPFDANGVF